MTANEIIDYAFTLFAEPNGSPFDVTGRAKLLILLNTGYKEVLRVTKCSRTTADISTASGTVEYSYPTGFVSLHQAIYNETILNPIHPYNALVNSSGYPSRYYTLPSTIAIDPPPDGTYIVTLKYFQTATTELILTDTPSLVPTAWHHILSYYLVSKLYLIDKAANAEAFKAQWNQEYISELGKMEAYYNKQGQNADRLPEM